MRASFSSISGVAAPALDRGQALVVRLLERLERAHHLAMGHHGLGRNAGLGLGCAVWMSISMCVSLWIG